MKYEIIDKNTYYRNGVFKHFSDDCKCSLSITNRVDVTALVEYSKKTDTKFYINFLYLLGKVINSRKDYRTAFNFKTGELIAYEKMNLSHYFFHEDTETCTVVYSEFFEDYNKFYSLCALDIEKGKQTREYGLDEKNHPNYFDASYISWISYDSLNIELPDGYLYFPTIVNWGRYRKEGERLMMPVSVRMNHAIADGYLCALVFKKLQEEIDTFGK